jgi:plastocyanin
MTRIVVVLASLLLAACSGGGNPAAPGNTNPGGGQPPAPQDGNTITLTASAFSPSTLTVAVGTTVRWVNSGAGAHTITPDGHTRWQTVNTSSAGEALAHNFTVAGTFRFLCSLHAGMSGSVTVQ